MEFKFTGGRGTASSSHTSGGIFKHPWWSLLCGKLQTWYDSSGWEVFASGHCVRSWIRPTLHPRRLRSQLGSLGHMDLLLQGEPVDQASGKSFTEVKVLTSIFPLLDIVGPRELDWQRSVFFPANCIVGSKPTLRSLLLVSMWEIGEVFQKNSWDVCSILCDDCSISCDENSIDVTIVVFYVTFKVFHRWYYNRHIKCFGKPLLLIHKILESTTFGQFILIIPHSYIATYLTGCFHLCPRSC